MADEKTDQKTDQQKNNKNTESRFNPTSPDCSDEQLKLRENSKGKVSFNTSVFYVDVKVFLEGVQVPHNSVSVSYGVNGPPTASITIPAAQFLRYIPNLTKVLIVYRDFCKAPNEDTYKYRVLFDGEVSGCSIQITPNGANMQIEALHSTGYLYIMQITNQAVSQIIYNQSEELIGDLVFITTDIGGSKVSCKILETIFNEQNRTKIKTMNDIVYLVLKAFLHSYKDFKNYNVAHWYYNKLADDVPGSHKLLKRIYNVDAEVQKINVDVSLPELDVYAGNNSSLRGYNPDGATNVNGDNGGGTSGSGGSSAPGDGQITKGSKTYDTAPDSPLSWPFKGGGPYYEITSAQGPRNVSGGSRNHKGVDIGCPSGTPIYAAGDGIASITSSDNISKGQGLCITIKHSQYLYTTYMHLSKISIKNGQEVHQKSKVIGYSGNTGYSTGPHLHFEITDSPFGNAYVMSGYLKKTIGFLDPKPVEPIGGDDL